MEPKLTHKFTVEATNLESELSLFIIDVTKLWSQEAYFGVAVTVPSCVWERFDHSKGVVVPCEVVCHAPQYQRLWGGGAGRGTGGV